MATEQSPAFQFYVKEWRSSRAILRMTFAQRGMYLEMLLEQWESLTLPDDPAECAEIIGGTVQEWTRNWLVLRRKFVTDDQGRIFNARLEKERTKQRYSVSGGKKRAEQAARDAAGHFQPAGSPAETPAADPATSSVAFALPIAIATPEKDKSASPSDDPFTNPTTTERAARFLDRYEDLYQQHRHGARYARKPVRDYAAAVTLCTTWDDDAHLDKLAVIFLTTDHKFAEEGSRTVPQFLALASWCDSRYAAHKAQKAQAV